ncbi:hypothetical protein ACA910_005970 [Epithemia clementina (nom. ined.)]
MALNNSNSAAAATLSMSISDTTDSVGAVAESAELVQAKNKLASGSPPFNVTNLPRVVDNPLWQEIRSTYNLSFEECCALQNSSCSPRPRGSLPRIQPDGQVYRIHDDRIRAAFTIASRPTPDGRSYTMAEELLLDSGAQSELMLPARKVVQLGLRQVGNPLRTTGSTNHSGMVLNFEPVLVTASFDRNGVQEIVENYLAVHCDKKEYDDYLAANATVAGVSSQQALSTQLQGAAVATTATSTPTLTTTSTLTTTANAPFSIQLSPAKHRPSGSPRQQAVIGIDGLKKLRLHLNCALQRLEIEEEEVLDLGEW